MDTTPTPLSPTKAPLTKIPSLTKPSSVKVLKPSVKTTFKASAKSRNMKFKSRHERLMEKRKTERLEKYKVFIFVLLLYKND